MALFSLGLQHPWQQAQLLEGRVMQPLTPATAGWAPGAPLPASQGCSVLTAPSGSSG